MKAIPTVFKGIEYRSRLEARWAAFFDRLNWQYTYEPFDGDGYIPDFLIHGERPFLVEVKPATTREDYREPTDKIARGLADHWHHPVLLVGVSPTLVDSEARGTGDPLFGFDSLCSVFPGVEHPDTPAVGWLGQRNTLQNTRSWTYAPASVSCLNDDTDNIYLVDWPLSHANQHARFPHNPPRPGNIVAPYRIDELWAEACNDVKWRGRSVA